MEQMVSRFFLKTDIQINRIVLPLHGAWWSRSYEYAWAGTFADTGTVLDAACGIEHPFKFFLLDHAQKVHACDMEEGILSKDVIRKGIRDTYGETAAASLQGRYLDEVHFHRASITKLPYEDGMFDRIFCISVLEHLHDHCNRHTWLPRVNIIQSLLKRDILLALGEFKRTLKDDGLIVLTFDYPNINLEYLTWIISCLGLAFAGKVSFDIPDNALYSENLHLYCFRAVLKKGNKGFKL